MNPTVRQNSFKRVDGDARQKKLSPGYSGRLVRATGLLLLIAMIGISVYSTSTASSSRKISKENVTKGVSRVAAPAKLTKFDRIAEPRDLFTSVNSFHANLSLMPMMAVVPIEVDASGCGASQLNFNLNESACVKVTGAQYIGLRIAVVDPQNLVRDVVDITNSPQTLTFPIPNTTTSSFGSIVSSNLGTWRAYILGGDSVPLEGAHFVVRDPAQATSNVEIYTTRTGGSLILDGSIVTYDITMFNYGPDAAVNAKFTNPTPPFTTFQGISGPIDPPSITCTNPAVGETGDVICTITSLAPHIPYTFTVQYQVGTVGAGSAIDNTATVSTDTANTSEATTASSTGNVTTETPSSGCTLTCPSNITVTADTTDPNDATIHGAYVTFSSATSSGTCGTVTSEPASGSFFPVGTTDVETTSSTGGGDCSFRVTVTESGSAVSIACPANKTANADSNCSAVVTLGTPTTTGDNVTVSVTRSDGLPMYDCSVPGPNCVHDGPRMTTDLPFSAGVTVVTWTASNSSGTATCQQVVTVYDVTAPTITASNSTVSADANCQAAVPDYSTAASDNCACASSDTSQICDSRHDITVTQDVAPGTLVGLGPHTIHLTANDGAITPGPDGIIDTEDDIQGNVSLKTITFTVNDTTPPTITAPAAVTAYTGPGATTCDTVVTDATLGTPTTSDNCGPITVTRTPSGNTFGVGTTTITWKATDGAGNFSTATQTVTVIDNTVPVITTNGQTPSMWPPNHELHTFQVTDFVTSVFDNCGGVSVSNVVISQVTSDELDDSTGGGDGNTTNDIQIAANCKSVQLRSERAGSGDGRVYIITFRLTDTHGNVTTATAQVVVPHDQGNGPETVIDSGVHYTVNGSCP